MPSDPPANSKISALANSVLLMGASFLMIAGGLVLLSKGDDGSQIAGSILIGSTFIGLTNLLRS